MLTAKVQERELTGKEVRRRVQNMAVGCLQRQEPEISSEQIRLAARDDPSRKAVGPDWVPAEFCRHCALLRGAIAELPNRMRVPLDKAGTDPTKSGVSKSTHAAS